MAYLPALQAALNVLVISAVEGPAGDAQLVERQFCRVMRPFVDAEELDILRRLDISFVVSPHPRSCFFERLVLQCQIGSVFLQGAGFTAQILHFAAGNGSGSVARKLALVSFNELL